MRSFLSRPTRPSWIRWPRRTARLRLTALYGGLFLISGAALLAITYLLFERATGGHVSRSLGQPGTGGIAQQIPGASGAAQRAAQRASDLHQLLVNSAIALAVVAVLALLAGWVVAGRMLRPVRTITATARRISATSLHERLDLQHADEEFRQLGDTLDDLLSRLDAAFEAQRHFIANASHELRTPLTRERALLEVALGDPSTPSMWQSTGKALLDSNGEQERLIDALLTLASSEAGLDHRELVDLAAIADDILISRRADADRLNVRIDTTINSAPVDGDSALLERLVANLIDNAIRHNVEGGRIRVSAGNNDGGTQLSISNTGPVIAPTDIDRLFQPFQRLNPRTRHLHGHGLGLSIVRAIATAHHATVTARTLPGGGLSVEVRFPTCDGAGLAHGSPSPLCAEPCSTPLSRRFRR